LKAIPFNSFYDVLYSLEEDCSQEVNRRIEINITDVFNRRYYLVILFVFKGNRRELHPKVNVNSQQVFEVQLLKLVECLARL